MTTKLEPVSREHLYELVWREPMLRVATRFGVSSSYMARVCSELRVPRPERGYWAKLEFGKQPQRPALPPALLGDVTQWKPGSPLGTNVRATNRARRLKATSASARKQGTESGRHELLDGVAPLFLKTRESDNGLLRPFKRLLVDIVSSEKHLECALEAADALFKALHKKGHRVAMAPPNSQTSQMRRAEVDEREVPQKNAYHRGVWSPDRITVVYVGDVPIGLTLFEMTEAVEMFNLGSSKYVPVRDLNPEQLRRYREPHYWRTTKDVPSGRLALQTFCPFWRVSWVKRWQESRSGQFASLLPSIIRDLEAAGPDLAQQLAEARRQAEAEHRKWEEQRRLAREEAERARQARVRQEARQDLLTAIAAWEQARSMQAYFAAIAREIEELPEGQREHLLGRLAEARELVGEVAALAKLEAWKSPRER